ncbi:MAG TPA: UTRA domain-containing protein, partial [Paracoccaceae bacterium]|nr:UTRA domain-containing protein [Paracoccaceae bacterium]
ARAEIEAAGRAYGFRMLARRVVRAGPEEPGFPAGTALIALECLHLGDGLPVMHEQRWINLGAVPAARSEAFGEQAPGEWLLAHVPWSLAEHRIRAVGAAGPVAAGLGIVPGTPCLEIARITWDGERIITFARLTWPGTEKVLVGRFGPASRDG